MRNISDKSNRDNQNAHFMFNIFFLFFFYHAVYEILSKNIVELDRPWMTVLYIANSTRFASWAIKSTNTHSECVILIAFLRQQWLGERTSMLCYAYFAYLVLFTEKYCFIALDFKKCSFLI